MTLGEVINSQRHAIIQDILSSIEGNKDYCDKNSRSLSLHNALIHKSTMLHNVTP